MGPLEGFSWRYQPDCCTIISWYVYNYLQVPVVRQQAVCVLCQSEKVTRTIQPCGHTYCSGN